MGKIKFLIISGIIFFCFLLCGFAISTFSFSQGQLIKNTLPELSANIQVSQTQPNSSQLMVPEAKLTTTAPVELKPVTAKPALGSMAIAIPNIGVRAQIVTVGLENNGELHVPGNSVQAGWYKYSSQPGDIGASVITGHMNFGKDFTPAVFYALNKLKIGDEIDVTRNDGSIAVFGIKTAELYRQNSFPTQKVYSPVNDSELRLITCAGTYDKTTKRYTHNLVVFASLVRIIPAA